MIKEPAYATLRLRELLAAVKEPGTIIKREDARKEIGPSLKPHHWQSAIRWCEKNHGQNWTAIPGVGYRLDEPGSTVDEMERRRKRTMRASKRALRRIGNAARNATPEQQITLACEATRHALFCQMTTVHASRRLLAATEAYGAKRLPPVVAVGEALMPKPRGNGADA